MVLEHLPTHDGGERRSLITCLGHLGVDAKAEAALATAERQEAAWRRAVAALGVFRPDGRLNDRTWVFRGKDILDARLKYSSF